MPIINKFDGGIVTGVDSHYLSPQHATVLINADIEKFGMQSAKKSVSIGRAERSFYQFLLPYTEPDSFVIESSNRWRSYAEFQGRLCYSDGGPICQITKDEYSGSTLEWMDMGVTSPTGVIKARPYDLRDIAGAKAVLKTGSSSSAGNINEPVINYRIVGSDGTVYIHEILNNTGNATVAWTLPSTYTVYRELINNSSVPSDKFVLVGSGSFTDGTVNIEDAYKRLQSSQIAEFSSHRMISSAGSVYSVPYALKITSRDATLHIKEIYELKSDDTWDKTLIDMSIVDLAPDTNIIGIASGFSIDDRLMVMAMLGSRTVIFDDNGVIIVDKPIAISEEFFKCTTIEKDSKVYMFDPSHGKVLIFSGTDFEIRDMPTFLYAKAEDSIFTLRGSKIYALLNDKHEAYIREFDIDTMKLSLSGQQRVKVDKVKGLGGSSGCNFEDGDFQLFPSFNSMVMYSPYTNQTIVNIQQDIVPPISKKISHTASEHIDSFFKGFVLEGSLIRSIIQVEGEEYAILKKWNSIQSSSPVVPAVFNEKTLTGVYLYNVAGVAASGADGSIMQVQGEPVAVYKGHIRVDLSGVTPPSGSELRLYRTGGFLTRYMMVEDVDPGALYKDMKNDQSLALSRIGKYDYVDPPPEGLKFLTEHRGRLWGAVDNTLYYSEPSSADHWDKVKSFIIMDRDVTALASTSFGLVVFMNGRSKLIEGTEASSFSLKTISNDKGTIDSRSVQAVLEGVIFFSDDGMCFTDGRQVTEISYDLLGSIRFNVIDSVATSRTYWALCDNFMGGSIIPTRILLRLDLGKQPQFSAIEANEVEGIGLINGRLSHSSKGILYDTLGGENRVFNYKSGNISMESPTYVKEWDKVRVSGEYFGWLIVRIDNVDVITEEIIVSIKNIISLHIPKRYNKGRSISFEFIGSGIITSIEYSITERSTTK